MILIMLPVPSLSLCVHPLSEQDREPQEDRKPYPLCTTCSTGLISARAQQTLTELDYLVLLRRKWQMSDRQEEEREMLTEKEKNGTSLRRQDGGNPTFFPEGSPSSTACP